LEGKYEELEDKLTENARVFQKTQMVRQKQKVLQSEIKSTDSRLQVLATKQEKVIKNLRNWERKTNDALHLHQIKVDERYVKGLRQKKREEDLKEQTMYTTVQKEKNRQDLR